RTLLREEGFDGNIVLLGEEHEFPYERPPLSKGYLLGKEDRSSIFVHEDSWYPKNAVDLRLGVRVTALDPAAKQVSLDDGGTVAYDRLLLATRAAPRPPNPPRAHPAGGMYPRRGGDRRRRPAPPPGGGHGAALGGGGVGSGGGGWVGVEVAGAGREAGCEVTLVEPEPVALYRQLGPELGEVFTNLHKEHGVVFRTRESVTAFHGSGGKVSAAVTSSGAVLPADHVVVGIGAIPSTGLATDAGLDVGNGVIVDAGLRSSAPDVFAAGDVANAFHPIYGRHIRVEHWANALNGGPAAARSMLGQGVSYDAVPYFYSDQYDLGMETAGLPEPGTYDQVVYRGDL